MSIRLASVAAVFALLGAVAPLPAAAQAPEQPAFEMVVVRDPQLGAHVAIAEQYGYFKEQGITPTIRWTQSGADVITFLGSGQQVIGTGGSLGQVLLRSQGTPIRTIASLADNAATQGLVLRAGVTLDSPKALEGRRLAFTQGTPPILIVNALAKLYGFDARKVGLVNLNQSEGVIAVSKGDVDGLLGWEPSLSRVVGMGGTLYASGTTLFVTGKPEQPAERLLYNNAILMANESWISGKPHTLTALLRALLKADRLLAEDRPKAMEALTQQLRVDADGLRVMTEKNVYGLALTESVGRAMTVMSDFLLEAKRIPAPVKLADLFAPGPLAAVDPALVPWKP